MNVLGYNFTSAPASPIPLPSNDITLSAGQLLEDLTLDEINPGSADAPAGDSYVVIDTAFDLELIDRARDRAGHFDRRQRIHLRRPDCTLAGQRRLPTTNSTRWVPRHSSLY